MPFTKSLEQTQHELARRFELFPLTFVCSKRRAFEPAGCRSSFCHFFSRTVWHASMMDDFYSGVICGHADGPDRDPTRQLFALKL